jgi:hypothetical protein
MDLHHKGHTADACDRRDIANEVEVQLEHRGIDGTCRSNQEQRVTVRRCSDDGLGGNAAAAARAILDDKRLPKSLRQRLSGQSRNDVRC